jgi:formylglycine-generating enzyme required for sulfatase activity
MRWSLKLAAIAGALLAALSATSMLAARGGAQNGRIEAPAVIAIRPQPFQYQLAGEFTRGGEPVDVPALRIRLSRAVVIMAHQVIAADYQRCVRDQGCPPAPEVGESSDRPAVKVSWLDAEAYAAWLSQKLGASYRLPTDEEWAFAAGSRFRGEPSPARGKLGPAQRWLVQYELEAGSDAAADGEPHPIGAFGTNENGVVDLAGNVWEWTSTCFTHHILDPTGTDAPIVNCGIRVAEGRHRAYLPDFIRDPRGGGCSTGLPPKNLGFRLVRESNAPVD